MNGRHPVVEQVLKKTFHSQLITLNSQRHLLIITGPNMGGKSTHMRQTALITLMVYRKFCASRKCYYRSDRSYLRV